MILKLNYILLIHTKIRIEHAMASAAIPFIFPSMQIDNTVYVHFPGTLYL